MYICPEKEFPVKNVIQLTIFLTCLGWVPTLSAASTKTEAVKAVPDETALAATRALRKLESKIEVGVTRTKYAEELADVDFAITEFEESDFGKKVPKAVLAYKLALDNHRQAARAWQLYIAAGPRYQFIGDGLSKLLTKYCPLQEETLLTLPERALDPCLADIWKRAEELSAEGRSLIAESRQKGVKSGGR
ncbi:hypothetical protein GCM10007388_01470 [Pseudoduganella plicata]|uniref:Uncharacterized protein n=2 Tax=Pseudoduganella plicata TaxID=321984 RepID=A0AA87Y354_9BURK|nr:hypothetical protein GCM10007388_01470 [Pseudoduganella plicata]